MCRSNMSGVGAQSKYEARGGLLQPVHAATDTTPNISSGEAQSNPTTSTSTSTTEHDFRFPRRPAHPHQPREASTSESATAQSGTGPSIKDSRASTLDKLDLSAENSAARKELLRESFFPTWKDDTAGEELDSPDEMQKKDPLATQIWRLYSKTKKQLPNQERMENLTWRMMAMSLRKRRQEEAARYVLAWMYIICLGTLSLTFNRKQSKQNLTIAPSGIAQLRKTSDQTPTTSAENPDAMNLDDYIFADNISTPAGLGNSPSPELSKREAEKSSNAVASAIPIKMRKESSQFAVPQSVPVPHHNPRNTDEFNYVQRHVRKTSIDERRVSCYFFWIWLNLLFPFILR